MKRKYPKMLGKESKIVNVNKSPLIGRSFEVIPGAGYIDGHDITVIWHQALSEDSWPSDDDWIFYIWDLDVEAGYVSKLSFAEFIASFKVPPLSEIKRAFQAAKPSAAKTIL